MVKVPISTYEKLGEIGSEVELITYLHLQTRQDIIALYGFKIESERDLFINLIKISGIGPKKALAIMSRFGLDDLTQIIADHDVKRLSTVSGVTNKTAEKLILELKDKLKIKTDAIAGVEGAPASNVTEAVRALETLGYTTTQADSAVRKAIKKAGGQALVEDIVKEALKGN